MGITAPLHAWPFFSGSSSAADVPGRFDVALNGRGFMLDTSGEQSFTRRPIALLRQQADTSTAPGEATLSPEELWRRSQDDWSHGAGQTFLDRKESDNRRFRSSKGVDVWERWALKLLGDTASKRATSGTNLLLCVVGTRLYLTDGASLVYTTSLTGIPTWTAVTGLPAPAPSAIASDGFNVWTAHGSSGVYRTTRSSGAASSLATGNVTQVGYAKGRLMAADGPRLYNITDLVGPAALPTVLFTHPNTDWLWLGFAEGQSSIYVIGYSGDKSAVYQITIKSDGSGLNQPTIAATLPDGEIVQSIATYVGGIVLLGTNKGVRFAVENSDGSLNIGGYISTTSPVLCFEPQDEYVWYGLTNYDGLSTGLGRLAPTVFTDDLVPAYASDLMATGQGAITSVVTFGNVRVFAVSGLGVFQEQTTRVASGTLDTGLITFGIPDTKVGMFLDTKLRAAVDTNRAYISVDSGPFVLIGTRSSTSVDPFLVGERTGETFEVRHEIVNADGDSTTGTVITRYTLRAYPNPHQGEVLTVPIRLFERVDTRTTQKDLDPAMEYELIRLLQTSRQLVPFQVGAESMTVLVDDHQFNAEKPTKTGKGWQGVCVLRLKALAT